MATAAQNEIAVVFDFDDTLTPDSTSKFLESRGVDPTEFWNQTVGQRVQEGWDPGLAWLQWFVEESGDGGQLEGLTTAELTRFGKELDFYPGVPGIFEDLRQICREHSAQPTITFFVVSAGLEHIIEGAEIARHLSGFRACRFTETKDGRPGAVRNTIGFTKKTRVLYEINKGTFPRGRTDPYAVNQPLAHDERPVPFENMIYVGDGLTDVPSFSVVREHGGQAFGVLDETESRSSQKAWVQLVSPRRVDTVAIPDYRPDATLGLTLRAAVRAISARVQIGRAAI